MDRRLGILHLAALAFFTVSGGPYGLEPLVGSLGFSGALALLLLTPLIFAVPIALAVAELASMMPERGGYYAWVKRGMGSFWAVQEGIWTLVYSVVDLAIYPVLFVNYLAFFFPYLNLEANHPWARWSVCLAMIGLALALNWRGTPAVAESALLGTALVCSPFLVLALAGWASPAPWPRFQLQSVALGGSSVPLSVGMATVLWNFSGWDNVSTYANEVSEPQKTYPRALGLSIAFVTFCYVLAVYFGCKVSQDPAVWTESQGFPVIGRLAGGVLLGNLFALLAILTSFMMLVAQFLYVPRIPDVLAKDGFLPSSLATQGDQQPPRRALLLTALSATLMAALPFGKLVVIDILLYGLALSLELLTLVVLRWRRPEWDRPFRVPLPIWALTVLVSIPLGVVALVAWYSLAESSSWVQLVVVLLTILLGPVVYWLGKPSSRANV